MRTIIEPFRIKMTEPLGLTSPKQRKQKLKSAHYNVFLLDAEDITIDLLTDSGTGAMSSAQWAALMLGDESYAGSRSWHRFNATVQGITGFKHIFPTHQGRAAERILSLACLKASDIVPNNSHFDTTRANIEFAGAAAVDLPCARAGNLYSKDMFKGDMDVEKLGNLIKNKGAQRIPFGMVTVTNNAGGGQPVSMKNIAAVKRVLSKYKIPLVIDCCRFAENAYFIKRFEKGYAHKSLLQIAQEMFSYADAATMSAKKDGLANIGGFLACNSDKWADSFRNLLILTEGFPTYGGLAGRDLEAISVGLGEALDYDYQHYRHATVEYIAQRLVKLKIPIVQPPGGHAIFIDAAGFCPHLKASCFPGIGLVNALYLEGGIRAVELGSAMFGRYDAKTGRERAGVNELVRLAFPRRVYTQSHFDYAIEVLAQVYKERGKIPAHKILKQAPFLRHFTAHFTPV
jgi:tryptophanase